MEGEVLEGFFLLFSFTRSEPQQSEKKTPNIFELGQSLVVPYTSSTLNPFEFSGVLNVTH